MPYDNNKHTTPAASTQLTTMLSRLLIRCFAGCSIDAIVAALGLTKADLFTEPCLRKKKLCDLPVTGVKV